MTDTLDDGDIVLAISTKKFETGDVIASKVTEKSFSGNFDGDGHTIYNLYYGKGDDWGKDFDPNDFDLAGWGSSLTDLDFSTWNKALFGLVSGGTGSDRFG